MLNLGRVNNAVRALSEWHRTAVGEGPDYNDRVVFTAHARAVLYADDRYLIGQTAPKADADRLRLKLAKANVSIEEMKLKVRLAQAAVETANRREREAAEAIEKAKALEEQAKGWQRSADVYCRRAETFRAQLEANDIEPDPRA